MEYEPNEKLRAEEIATALKVSRTPVREALGRLAQDGLVEKSGGWGYIVKSLTADDVLNLLQIREALEVEAVREAVPNMNAKAADALSRTLAKSEALMKQGRHVEFLAKNRMLHRTVAEIARNPLLLAMLQSIRDRQQMIGAMLLKKYPERAREIFDENRLIVKALKDKNAAGAEAAVRAQVRRARETIVKYLGFAPMVAFASKRPASVRHSKGGRKNAR